MDAVANEGARSAGVADVCEMDSALPATRCVQVLFWNLGLEMHFDSARLKCLLPWSPSSFTTPRFASVSGSFHTEPTATTTGACLIVVT